MDAYDRARHKHQLRPSPHHHTSRLHAPLIHPPASARSRHGQELSAGRNQQYNAYPAAAASAKKYKREHLISSEEKLPESPSELDVWEPPRNACKASPAKTVPSRVEYDRCEQETYSEEHGPDNAFKRHHSSASPAELDERKPPARATSSRATEMSPSIGFDSRLEWSESFSNEVCDYVLGPDDHELDTNSQKNK